MPNPPRMRITPETIRLMQVRELLAKGDAAGADALLQQLGVPTPLEEARERVDDARRRLASAEARLARHQAGEAKR